VKLLAIANATLVKKYGIEKVLSPIIEDLKKLYLGHEIEFDDGRNITLYGKVLVCLGQNLWGGFKESCGGAYQKCRACYCDFDSLQSQFDLSKLTTRTKELYNSHCDEIENAVTEELRTGLKTSYGINKRSILTELPGFDISKQLPQDIMHDAFELRSVIEYFVKVEGAMRLEYINGSLLNHHFGYSEIPSKPPKIRDSVLDGGEQYKLKFNADQARLFLRVFPFVFEPLISIENEYFKFVLDLVGIMQFLYSPVIRKTTITELDKKVQRHFTTFKELFPDKNLLPKHHFILHLVKSIKIFGPPIRYSCYSYEAAHNYFKSLGKVQNFKNLPYSLAKRYQYLEPVILVIIMKTAGRIPCLKRKDSMVFVKNLVIKKQLY